MAEALAYFGHPDTSETEVFLRHFDRLFKRQKQVWSKDLKAYTSVDDERLVVSLCYVHVTINISL